MDLLIEPPTFLFIQMQLCQKASLKDWLASNVTNRQRETVINYFEQVLPLSCFCVIDKALMPLLPLALLVFWCSAARYVALHLLLLLYALYSNKYVRAVPTIGMGGEGQLPHPK